MTKPEEDFVRQFRKHMKTNYYNFKQDYPTLVNRVIIPFVTHQSVAIKTYRDEVIRLEEENERLKQQIDGKIDRLS